jgi:D-aminopeptidase
MTRDIASVVRALFDAGVQSIWVKDFHRTGYNLLQEHIDKRARVISGYRLGPVPGIGDPGCAEAVMLIGMHAASGSDGFLAHTLTSRIAALVVNGRPMAEVELFAASLAPYQIKPIFFSGCPVACQQARSVIPGIHTHAIEKERLCRPKDIDRWRRGLAAAAVQSLYNSNIRPYNPRGSFTARVTMRDGIPAAAKIARRWAVPRRGASLHIEAGTIQELYHRLIRLVYLTPLIEKSLPVGLLAYGLVGRLGLAWVRRTLKLGFN